jgi:hypothetical protein
MNVFLENLFHGFGPAEDGFFFNWIIVLLVIYTILLKIKKQHTKVEKFSKLILILGLWGTFFIFSVVAYASATSDVIPAEDTLKFALAGTAASLVPILWSVIGWCILTLMDFFIKSE